MHVHDYLKCFTLLIEVRDGRVLPNLEVHYIWQKNPHVKVMCILTFS